MAPSVHPEADANYPKRLCGDTSKLASCAGIVDASYLAVVLNAAKKRSDTVSTNIRVLAYALIWERKLRAELEERLKAAKSSLESRGYGEERVDE